MATPDRRRTPRLEVQGRIKGLLEDINVPVRIRDVGLGGFSIETTDPVPVGSHVIRFSVDERWSISLTAITQYSRSFWMTDGAPCFVTGFEFVSQQSPETQRLIANLVERLASVIMFE